MKLRQHVDFEMTVKIVRLCQHKFIDADARVENELKAVNGS